MNTPVHMECPQPQPGDFREANATLPVPVRLRITPSKGLVHLRLGEIWAYRELLYFLVWRDIKVRYKQTAIGAAWAVLQPFLTMVVFSLFFGKLARIPAQGVPYPLFYYCALLPWSYFATSLQNATNVVIEQQRVITKIYFPRLVLPISAVLSGLVDFAIAFLMLLALMVFYHVTPSRVSLLLPLFLLLAVFTALGVGLWLSALNVKYRDVRYVVPFLLQFWMFASPVAYPSSLVPRHWRWVYGLNPMAGVIEGFRWALTGRGIAPGFLLLGSACGVALVLFGGLVYYQATEGTMADMV